MIKPTVGRVVWFTPPEQSFLPEGFVYFGSQPCAALVSYVWSSRMVNLLVSDHNGKQYAFTSVTLVQDDDPKPTHGRYAEWMPFQKGQAKAQEAAKT